MRYNTLRITTFIISYGTLILILLASGSLTSSGSHHLTNFNSGNLQEIPSKNNLMTRNSVSQIDGESYDFDIEYAFKYVDYTWLIEDPINVNRFFQDVLKRLDLGQFEEAEVLVKTKIDEYCKYYTTYGKSKFNDNDQECREAFETVRGLRPMTDNTFNDCIYAKLIQIHALTLELKGDYSEATAAYQLVFGANKKLFAWTLARLYYECGDPERAFSAVCDVVQTYYDLTPQDVDDVISLVKQTETKRKNGCVIDTNHLGVPIERDSMNRVNLKALEVYRIRDFCGRFMCPNLVYKKGMYAWDHNIYRVDSVKLIRDEYSRFLEFMEREYNKANQPVQKENFEIILSRRSPYTYEMIPQEDNRYAEQYMKDRFHATMALLRKISELPY